MTVAYRIHKSKYPGNSGEGAKRYGGRWNPPGVTAIYAANHASLAVLEILVHYNADRPEGYSLTEIYVPDSISQSKVPIGRADFTAVQETFSTLSSIPENVLELASLGFSIAEIAARMRESPPTVRLWIHRALQELKSNRSSKLEDGSELTSFILLHRIEESLREVFPEVVVESATLTDDNLARSAVGGRRVASRPALGGFECAIRYPS